MGLIKWLVRIFLVLVVLIVAAIILIPKFFNPNDYKDELADLVRKQTGRALVVEGDLKLSVFPWVGVNTNKMTLSQPNHLSRDFGGGNMLDVESAEIRVKTMPLLKSIFADKKDIRVATIKLKKPQVTLITTKAGITSLDGLTGDSSSPTKGDSEKTAAGAGVALVVQGVDLQDGLLVWDDRKAGQRYELKNFDLASGNLLGRSLQKISASGVLLDSSTPDLTTFNLNGKAKLNQETLQSSAEGLSFRVERGPIKANGTLASLNFVKDGLVNVSDVVADIAFNDPEIGLLNTKLSLPNASFDQLKTYASLTSLMATGDFKGDPFDVSLDQINVDLSTMQAKLASLVAKGKFQGENFDINGKSLDFNINKMAGALENLTLKGGFQGNTIDLTSSSIDFNVEKQAVKIAALTANAAIAELGPFKNRPIQLSGDNLRADMSKQTFGLNGLNFVSEDLKGSMANLSGTGIIDKPRIKGDLTIEPFNLRRLIQQMEIDYTPENAEALTSFEMSGKFDGGLDAVDISKLFAKLDDSTLTGSLGVSDFENPAARFNLSLNKLNMDDYLPPSEDKKTQDEAAGAEALAVPLAAFEKFKANGKLRIDSFEGGGLNVDRIAVDVKSSGNTTTVVPSAKLYSGAFDGKIKYENTVSGGRLSLKQNLKSINLFGLFKDLDLTDQLSGIADVGVDMVIEEVNGKQTNRGKITLGARDGAIKGIDIQKMLSSVNNTYSSFKGKDLVDSSKFDDETKFASLGGTFELNDSKLDNLDFDMKAPLFRVRGTGEVDIVKQILDYTVNISIVDSLRGQGGESLDKLRGITLPVRFTGDLTQPKYRIDMKALVKSLAGKKIDKKLNAAVAKKLGIEGASEKGTKGVVSALANKKLKEKYGVEPESLSSKDVLGSLLQQKLQKKYGAEPTLDNQQPKVQDADPQVITPSADNKLPDQRVQENTQEEKPLSKEELKKQAKDELKRKLLENLFK